jgi:hypothetical protein
MPREKRPCILPTAIVLAVLVTVPAVLVGRQGDDIAGQYRTVRRDVLQTTLAKHVLVLLGSTGNAAPSILRNDLEVLRRSLAEAHRAVVQVHDARRKEIETLIGRPIKPRVSSTIEVIASSENRAETDATGRIRISSGFLRSQVDALITEMTDDDTERRAFASGVRAFQDATSFAKFHAIHERKWQDTGFEELGTMIILSDFEYRGGLQFVVAHELGHLALGHFESMLDCRSRQAAELEADRYAVALLGIDLALGDNQYENPAADVLRGMAEASGYNSFFLVGYPEAFVPESGGTCRIYAPAEDRAELLEPIARSAAEKYAIPQIIERYKAEFDGYAPGVTAAVIEACRISTAEALEKIAGTIDAIRSLYGADSKRIVQSILDRLGKGERPDCARGYLFD